MTALNMTTISNDLTTGESLFEQACAHAGMTYRRIPVARVAQGHRRPDYRVTIPGRCGAIVEVKQLEPNAFEERELAEHGSELPRPRPGERLRGAIRGSREQLKKASQLGIPTAVAVYDTMHSMTYTDASNVKVAMYGLDTFIVRAHENSRSFAHMKSGGKATMTKEHNTSISAVIIIRVLLDPPPVLIMYHNHFARVRFDPNHLRGWVSDQFELKVEKNGAWRWMAV